MLWSSYWFGISARVAILRRGARRVLRNYKYLCRDVPLGHWNNFSLHVLGHYKLDFATLDKAQKPPLQYSRLAIVPCRNVIQLLS